MSSRQLSWLERRTENPQVGGSNPPLDKKIKVTLKLKDSLIRLKSFEHGSLNDTVDKIKVLSKEHNISLGGVVPLPTKKTKMTLLRSPHVNKQSREQFEIRKHSRVLRVETLDKEKVLAFLKEVSNTCPVGVTIKTTLGFVTKGKV